MARNQPSLRLEETGGRRLETGIWEKKPKIFRPPAVANCNCPDKYPCPVSSLPLPPAVGWPGLNKTGTVLLTTLLEAQDTEAAVKQAAELFDAPENIIAKDLEQLVEDLLKRKLLVEEDGRCS